MERCRTDGNVTSSRRIDDNTTSFQRCVPTGMPTRNSVETKGKTETGRVVASSECGISHT